MPKVLFVGLNISAQPHPEGIYRELFERVAGKRVAYYGDKIAAISRPSPDKDGEFWGYIHTWTEIDKSQKFIDTILLREPKEEEISKINIPENIGFNSHIFIYVFNKLKHSVLVESKNNEGASLSSGAAEKIFRSLFGRKSLDEIKFTLPKPTHVEVDLAVEKNALQHILSMQQIRRIEIFVSVPNSDDNTNETDKLLDHLRAVKARSQTTIYSASDPKVGIKPDSTILAESSAALDDGRHGYVQADGRSDGQNDSRSSKSYPRTVSAWLDPNSSTLDSAIQIAKRFFGS